jgi:hypothetical protein
LRGRKRKCTGSRDSNYSVSHLFWHDGFGLTWAESLPGLGVACWNMLQQAIGFTYVLKILLQKFKTIQ